MNDSTTVKTTRRRSLKLPRRRWHILGAATISLVSLFSLYQFISRPAPAHDFRISGDVILPGIPQPIASTNLNGEGEGLPDLLAGDVADGENPTTMVLTVPKTDALGNPIKTPAPSPNTPTDKPAPKPKTILIDGKSINGGSTQIFSELTRQGPFGSLPQKTTAGNTAFKAYRRTSKKQNGKQPVSIIIGGLGINVALTQDAIALLPSEVTLSFAAQSNGLQGWINKAREDGHEVMIEIPMESQNFNPAEPGANRTLKADDVAANKRHLDWLLSRGQGYFGVINYNGDKFLTRADAAVDTLNRFSDSGLAFVSDGAFSAPSLGALAQSVNLPYKKGFGLIDPEPNPSLIQIELSRLNAAASSGSAPVGIGFAYPETIQAVSEWVKSLSNESLQLVPASATFGG